MMIDYYIFKTSDGIRASDNPDPKGDEMIKTVKAESEFEAITKATGLEVILPYETY